MLAPVNKQLTLFVGVKAGAGTGTGGIGEPGPQGPVGPAGPQGAVGPAGATGPQGPAGTNGTNGANGTNGTNGATGAQGPMGPSGPAGETTRSSTATVTLGVGTKTFPYTATAANIGWSIGTRLRAFAEAGRYMEGVVTTVSSTSVTFLSDFFSGTGNGSVWDLSIAGDRGTNGTNGVDGVDGLTGPTGPAGAIGPTGPAGATGAQGIQGEIGPEGPAGPEGPVGSIDLSLLDAKQNLAEKGSANGYASLNSSGKVPASQLPTSTGDIIEYTNISLFPGTGEIGTIYIALDTDTSYIWDDDTSTYTTQTTVGSLPSNAGFKVPCRLVATSNIDVATGGFPTIDGKLVANKYRILLTAQTDPAENGIWIAAAGAWARANDANVIAEVRAALVSVWQGTTYGGSLWFTTFDQGDTLGTTAMPWYRVPHAGNIVAMLDGLLGSDMWRSVGADGADGATGPMGPPGADGIIGVDGDSAYDIAVANGFVGSQAAWLASLVGATGPAGATGSAGPTGAAGATGPAGTSFPAFNRDVKTANYVAVTGDFVGNKLIKMNVASANDFTINTGLTGTEPVSVYQQGAGQTTLVAGGGVTLVSSQGLKLRAQHSVLTIIPNGTDSYIISGDTVV